MHRATIKDRLLGLNRTLILIVLAAVLAGLFLGGQVVRNRFISGSPSDVSADAGFARDMGDHHQQAVDMSFIIRDKTQDKAIGLFAYDVINTQATQRGIMMGWLEQWGLPQTTTRPAMAWMNGGNDKANHGTERLHHELMPGMASQAEMDKLRSLTGKEADKLFLELMIKHHAGGVSMSEGLLTRSKRGEVKRLAQTIIDGQKAEIEALSQILKDRQ